VQALLGERRANKVLFHTLQVSIRILIRMRIVAAAHGQHAHGLVHVRWRLQLLLLLLFLHLEDVKVKAVERAMQHHVQRLWRVQARQRDVRQPLQQQQ
jgi:hypothetical protein